MKKIALIFTICFLFLMMMIPSFSYNNPIPFYDENNKQLPMGDPFVMKYNGTYYCYARGICFKSEDLVNWTLIGDVFVGEHSENLYAPEVFYWNGAFYTVSASNGQDNYLFKSDSPEGPFTAIKGPISGDIDSSFFRDDDGRIYLVNAEWQGILMAEMETPESTPTNQKKLPQSMSKMWTEGPSIFKRNGKYYMTFTGNHVLDAAYRVEYAMSDSVKSGWVEPEQNILLLSTGGETSALGHNSVVIGPDLDTYYIIYHNRFRNTNPIDRGFNMQRVLWNGTKMVVALNTDEAEDPKLPDYQYRPDDGLEIISGRLLSDASTENVYTAEFNIVPAEAEILFAYNDESNYAKLSFTDKSIVLETVVENISDKTEAELAKNTDISKLQCIRIQQTENELNIYLEGGLLIKTEPFYAGKIGYSADNGTVGYMAFSDLALGNKDHLAEKYSKATYDAVFANNIGELSTVASKELGNAVKLSTGEHIYFDLTSSKEMNSTLTLRGCSTEGANYNIYLDGKLVREGLSFPSGDEYTTAIIRSVLLGEGVVRLEIEVMSGELELYEIATTAEEAVEPAFYNMMSSPNVMIRHEGSNDIKSGKYVLSSEESPKGDCFGKTVIGDYGWGDYCIEVSFAMDTDDEGAEAGIFVRSPNVSNGQSSSFRFRNKWYQQCYYIGASKGKICLYKQNYNETLLESYETDCDFTKQHDLKVLAFDSNIIVYLDGEKIISYTDNDHPFTNGKAGFKVLDCQAKYDDLNIRPLTEAEFLELTDIPLIAESESSDTQPEAEESSVDTTACETVEEDGSDDSSSKIAIVIAVIAAVVIGIVLIIILTKNKKLGR